MAQQITANNSSIINTITTTNNSFVDTSSTVNFDDIFNKSVNTTNNVTSANTPTTSAKKNFTQGQSIQTASTVSSLSNRNLPKTNDNYTVTAKSESTSDCSQLVSNMEQSNEITINDEINSTTIVDPEVLAFDSEIINPNIIIDSALLNTDSIKEFTNNEEAVVDTNTENLVDSENVNAEIEINLDSTAATLLDNKSTEVELPITDTNKLETKNIAPNTVNVETSYNTDSLKTIDSENQVSVKIANNSNIQQTSNIDVPNKMQNQITQDLIDELNVEIVQSTEDNITLVSDNTTDVISKLNDASELQLRESVEHYEEVQIKPVINNQKQTVKTNEIKTSDIQDTIETTDTVVTKETSDTKDLKTNETSAKNEKDIEISDNIETEIKMEVETDNYSKANSDTNSDKKDSELNEKSKISSDKKDLKSDLRDKIFSFASKEETTETDITAETVNDIKVNSVDTVKPNTQNISVSTNSTITTKNGEVVSKENILSQIHDKIQFMNKVQNSKLTMILNPESLGKVSVQLTNTNNGLTAEMVVDSPQVKEILDKNLTELRNSLTGQGVNVDNVSVRVAESENNTEMDYTEQDSESNSRNQQEQKESKKEDEQQFEKLFSEFDNKNGKKNTEMGEE